MPYITHEELERARNDKEGVHQGLMNIAYDRWHAANEGAANHVRMDDWFDSLSEIERAAVALGKLNQQVCNGGFVQWHDNRYGKIMAETCREAMAAMPQTSAVQAVAALVAQYCKFWEEALEEYAAADRECDDCCNCCDCPDDLLYQKLEALNENIDDAYYDVNEPFLRDCNDHFTTLVDAMLTNQEVAVLTSPGSIDIAPVVSETKPRVKLLGGDGNAFVILGACRKSARRSDWSNERIEMVLAEMQEGDYDHLLATACKYFEVS